MAEEELVFGVPFGDSFITTLPLESVASTSLDLRSDETYYSHIGFCSLVFSSLAVSKLSFQVFVSGEY